MLLGKGEMLLSIMGCFLAKDAFGYWLVALVFSIWGESGGGSFLIT